MISITAYRLDGIFPLGITGFRGSMCIYTEEYMQENP